MDDYASKEEGTHTTLYSFFRVNDIAFNGGDLHEGKINSSYTFRIINFWYPMDL